MVNAAAPIVGVLAVVLGVVYQFALQPKLYYSFGVGRPVEPKNVQGCEIIPELEACEDTWYHQPSGLLYLACSSKAGRHAWLPNADHYDTKKRPDDDYFAIVDTKASGSIKSNIKKITPQAFTGNNGRGSYNLHGFGVYMDGKSGGQAGDAMRLFVINHRPQPNAETIGANSTIELFESTLGSDTMHHLKTFVDADVISTPNDLVPVGPDSFVFSNDHAVKIGPKKQLDFFLPRSALGYCGSSGCKITMSPVQYPNGLGGGLHHPHTEANIIYQASTSTPYIQVLEMQADKGLVLIDRIRTDYIMDNLSTDEEGGIWAAGFPKAFETIEQMKNPNPKGKSSVVALRATKNKGQGAFYGEKYKVDRMLEDNGSVLNFITSVSYDTERKMAFLGSVLGPTAFCKLAHA